MLLGPHGDRQKSVFNPKHYKTGLNLNHSVKLTICLKPPPELTDVVRVKTFRASFISSSCYTQGGFILFKWGSNFVVYSKGFFFSLGNRCQCLKLTCSLDLWRHLHGEARQAAWCRLLEISILHLKVALPHCCVSVSNLMLLIKKIPTWSKQWSPPPFKSVWDAYCWPICVTFYSGVHIQPNRNCTRDTCQCILHAAQVYDPGVKSQVAHIICWPRSF